MLGWVRVVREQANVLSRFRPAFCILSTRWRSDAEALCERLNVGVLGCPDGVVDDSSTKAQCGHVLLPLCA